MIYEVKIKDNNKDMITLVLEYKRDIKELEHIMYAWFSITIWYILSTKWDSNILFKDKFHELLEDPYRLLLHYNKHKWLIDMVNKDQWVTIVISEFKLPNTVEDLLQDNEN